MITKTYFILHCVVSRIYRMLTVYNSVFLSVLCFTNKLVIIMMMGDVKLTSLFTVV